MGGRKRVARFEFLHDPIICISEAIDRLLGIAHGKETSSLGKGILDEGKEIGPLNGRGVLEFIDQVVVDRLPNPKVDIGHDFMIEVVRKLFVDVMDEDGAFPFLYLLENIFESFIGPEIGTVISRCIELNIFSYSTSEKVPLFRYSFEPGNLFFFPALSSIVRLFRY
jgi:hypothetical protein